MPSHPHSQTGGPLVAFEGDPRGREGGQQQQPAHVIPASPLLARVTPEPTQPTPPPIPAAVVLGTFFPAFSFSPWRPAASHHLEAWPLLVKFPGCQARDFIGPGDLGTGVTQGPRREGVWEWRRPSLDKPTERGLDQLLF